MARTQDSEFSRIDEDFEAEQASLMARAASFLSSSAPVPGPCAWVMGCGSIC
jgi:hypothetical protein